jgi:hypothetical protein
MPLQAKNAGFPAENAVKNRKGFRKKHEKLAFLIIIDEIFHNWIFYVIRIRSYAEPSTDGPALCFFSSRIPVTRYGIPSQSADSDSDQLTAVVSDYAGRFAVSR